jgi:hypothetical protein
MRKSHRRQWFPKPCAKGSKGGRAKGPDTMSAGKQRRSYGTFEQNGENVSWEAFKPHDKSIRSTDVRPLRVCVKDGDRLSFAPVDRVAADLAAQATELLATSDVALPDGIMPEGGARKVEVSLPKPKRLAKVKQIQRDYYNERRKSPTVS